MAVAPHLSVTEGHAIAKEVSHQLLHRFASLSSAMVHVDPVGEAGDEFHVHPDYPLPEMPLP